ncbi:discoidin domain-containing protein [Clostridium botulinum]
MTAKNLALNKPVYTSEPADSNFPASNVNNGVLNVNNGYLTNIGNKQVLITIELEKPYIINLIKLKQVLYVGNRRCKEFDIKYSDNGTNYTTIFSSILEDNDLIQNFKINHDIAHKYWGLFIKSRYDNGGSGSSYGIGEIELYSIYRYLIKQNDQYYTIKSDFYKNGNYESIPELEGKKILTETDFETYGIDDLNLLTKNIDTQVVDGIDKGSLGGGKMFEISFNNNFMSTSEVI